MKTSFFTVICLLSIVTAGFTYEMRTWEAVDGHPFKGRFYREMFGKLTIEKDDGTRVVLGIETMSALDKKYLRVMIPPKIEVEVRTKTKQLHPRPMALWRDDIEKMHIVTATILKKSQRPFTSRLKAEMFMVGKEADGDNYILLKRFDEDFLLIEGKDYQYEVRSPPVKTTRYTNITDNAPKGESFYGYLLILTSMQGDVLMTDSNLPAWLQQPEVVKNLRELSVRGAPSIRSRHFDKTGGQVPPARPTACPMRTT